MSQPGRVCFIAISEQLETNRETRIGVCRHFESLGPHSPTRCSAHTTLRSPIRLLPYAERGRYSRHPLPARRYKGTKNSKDPPIRPGFVLVTSRSAGEP